jgi:hypothetical protein
MRAVVAAEKYSMAVDWNIILVYSTCWKPDALKFVGFVLYEGAS